MRSSQIHYENGQGYDVIDFVKHYDLNFNRGNIIKYVARASKKGTELQDLKKAMDYLQREIDYMEQKREEVWTQNASR
jgi:hypothetical protein